MFTGIIEKMGTVAFSGASGASHQLRVKLGWSDLALGESVAVNGVCLTVESLPSPGEASFDVSLETLRRTGLGSLAVGDKVHLERALSFQGRLSGHYVQGHVDGVGKLGSAAPEGTGYRVEFEIPAALARYCVEKGAIALDGVSLTVGTAPTLAGSSLRFAVFMVPYTWQHTRFSLLQKGAPINVEVDIIAKYVEQWVAKR